MRIIAALALTATMAMGAGEWQPVENKPICTPFNQYGSQGANIPEQPSKQMLPRTLWTSRAGKIGLCGYGAGFMMFMVYTGYYEFCHNNNNIKREDAN